MARFTDGQRRLYSLQIPHFSDQNYVRVLAQDVAQSPGEIRCVLADLSLIHDAVLVRVQVLDRIFDGDMW